MHVFLSPHFDDAALSCGGTIHLLARHEEAVQILTVMGGESRSIPDSAIVRELHARWEAGENPVRTRQREDVLAAKRLGATTVHGSYPDCIYRTIGETGLPCYPTAESLFREVHPFDPAAAGDDEIGTVVLASATTLYAPLGAGHHVDHQIVRNLGIRLKRDHPSLALKFYEEYPYIRERMAAQHALDLMAWIAPDLRLELEIIELSEADVRAKVEAIACYQTQISSFWPDVRAMEQEVQQMLMRAGAGVLAERYWKVVGSQGAGL